VLQALPEQLAQMATPARQVTLEQRVRKELQSMLLEQLQILDLFQQLALQMMHTLLLQTVIFIFGTEVPGQALVKSLARKVTQVHKETQAQPARLAQ
jgi:hypothetical protein